MKLTHGIGTAGIIATLTGCGGLVIDGDPEKGMTYFEPVPYALAQTNVDCTQSVTAVVLAGEKHTVRLKSGFWSSKQSVSFANGMITSAGTESDNQVPATISALTTLATAGVLWTQEKKTECIPQALLTKIEKGTVVRMPPIVESRK